CHCGRSEAISCSSRHRPSRSPRRPAPRNDGGNGMTTEALYLQQLINGLSLGAMYALLALGFTLVYGILELINFAHFNVFMVSSFVAMWALELLGLQGQSTVLTGFALVGTLVFAFVVTMLAGGVI